MPTRFIQSESVLGSPLRNLVSVLVFVGVVTVAATIAYMAAGWSFADASYMVTLTVFSVGYGEVHPVNTAYLHTVTMATMVLGCTGMILLTSTLVQFFTVMQLRDMLGKSTHDRIEKLSGHVIICGYGRIGVMLARDLASARTSFLVLERDPTRREEAEAAGHLTLAGDATEEDSLVAAGIARARALATVLPDDTANVFITLTARSLNPALEIIARGEMPSTESKLRYAGADRVILPTHIGAERIARMLLYPESDRLGEDEETARLGRDFSTLGLALEQLIVVGGSSMDGLTVAEAERRANGSFFIVRIDRGERGAMVSPAPDERLTGGERVMLVTRPGATRSLALFSTRAEIRAGRNVF